MTITEEEIKKYKPNYLVHGKIFSPWAEKPGEITKHGPFYLKWHLSEEMIPSPHWTCAIERQIKIHQSVSVDKIFWEELTWKIKHPSYDSPPLGTIGPSWLKKDLLREEIEKSKKIFMRERAKVQAVEREKLLIKKAEKLGVEPKALKAFVEEEKTKKLKNRNEKILKNKATKLVKNLEGRMKIALRLKDLIEAARILDEKINDNNCDLVLAYINKNLVKLQSCTSALKDLSIEQNKKTNK